MKERESQNWSPDRDRGGPGCLELEPLLAEYAEGTLREAERTAVERHLAGCLACREMLGAVSAALAVCRQSGAVAAPPRLVARILEQTTGKLPWTRRLRSWLRPALEPRLALGTAMAVISFSIVLNAVGVDLRQVTLADLSPTRIYTRLDRTVHLAGTRAMKYYNDLRIVYEIQTQLQAIRETAAPAEEQQARPQPKQQQPPQQPARPPAPNKWSRQALYLAAGIL